MNIKMIDPDKIDCKIPEPQVWNGKFILPWGNERLSINQAPESPKKGMKVDRNSIPSKEELDRIPLLKVLKINKRLLSKPPIDGIQTTWLGHSTILIQFDGLNILTDPVFSQSCRNPWTPGSQCKRYREAPCKIEDLPQIDLVIISHDHSDHLDIDTIKELNRHFPDINWYIPTGTASLLSKTGCNNILELGWKTESLFYKKTSDNIEKERKHTLLNGIKMIKGPDLKIISVPAQHWCRRTTSDSNTRLWCGFVLKSSSNKSIYYSGDTGYCDVFKAIGDIHGPFDFSIIPIGGYNNRDTSHCYNVNPSEAVKIHQDVKSKRTLAVHWGTFQVSNEFFLEPPQLLAQALEDAGINSEEFFCLHHGETRVMGDELDSRPDVNNKVIQTQLYSSYKIPSQLSDSQRTSSYMTLRANMTSRSCVLL